MTAKVIAGIVAVIASYILNREWSFRDRGGRERHHEALLFFAFSGVGVLLSMAPLWFSSYVLQLRVPTVSLTVENIADFISAYIIGNLLQMAFRFWAFRRWVFPDEFARDPRQGAGIRAHRRRYRRGVRGRFEERQRHAAARLARPRRPAERISSAIPRNPGCRRLRDTAARAPARTRGMSWNSNGSCDADSMISVPVRSIRSMMPCRNSTLLIRASGMSMPLRVSTPCRNITRRSVMTKCVVSQFRNGHTVSQPTSTSQTAPMTQ